MPPSLPLVLDEFEAYLDLERGRSAHTRRAYLGDLRSLFDFLELRVPGADLSSLSLPLLRSWLASQAGAGAARTTLARRTSAVKTFTAWATRRGLLDADPAIRLQMPKARRTLPAVLRQDQAVAAMNAASSGAQQGDPLALRDRLIVELLYATGIRVSELCGLDVDDVDVSRRVLRVLGKGDKQRTAPFGTPAEDALRRWLADGRPALVSAASGPALLLGARGGRLDARQARTVVHETMAAVDGAPDIGPARSAAQRRHPPVGRRRGSADRPGTARSLVAGDHPALHACDDCALAGRARPSAPPRLNRHQPVEIASRAVKSSRARPWAQSRRRRRQELSHAAASAGSASTPVAPADRCSQPAPRHPTSHPSAGTPPRDSRDGRQPTCRLHHPHRPADRPGPSPLPARSWCAARPGWASDTSGRPASTPAKITVPGPAA